ncbi:lamin tail domain-containing protein [Candidatus Azambacteria bacterium]|nr:lamin tail domain-containing protein [Candidatus Azambacteria bacterium]
MLHILYASLAVISFFVFASPVHAAVLINEIFYDPAGTDTGQEAIELYNNADELVTLTGYDLNAVSGDYFTFPTFTLGSRAFAVVHTSVCRGPLGDPRNEFGD